MTYHTPLTCHQPSRYADLIEFNRQFSDPFPDPGHDETKRQLGIDGRESRMFDRFVPQSFLSNLDYRLPIA